MPENSGLARFLSALHMSFSSDLLSNHSNCYMILTIAKCFWKIQQKKTVENSFNCYDKVMNLMKKEET